MKYSIGIDTSCYTTSIVALDQNKNIVFNDRIVLPVKKGTFGLRQSDAFFQHVKNLTLLYKNCLSVVDAKDISAICVSDKPRPIDGSYMPVFTAGLNIAQVISDSLPCPLYLLSHQENHLYAVACEFELPKKFIGVHISGGTSELLKIDYNKSFDIELIGETLDLSFGKLIDRIGVYMGLDFPSGKALDDLRTNPEDRYLLKLSIKEMTFNISGFENKLKAYYDVDKNISKISNTLFYYLAKLLEKILNTALEKYNLEYVVISGGVSANSYLREYLMSVYEEKVIFPSIKYSTDHALGNAYYGSQVEHD